MTRSIAAPEGVSVSIARNVFGKAISVTRSGSYAGAGVSVTRSYVYDANQRLCKTVEPEVGATVQDYDGANNAAWKAPGQSLSSTSDCNRTSVAAAAQITYGYDKRNRLLTTGFGDNSPGITRSYTADGLLASVAANNATWSYGYNRRRLLASETLAYGGQSYGIGHGWDANGHAATLGYPDGTSIAYSPNALGQPTQAGDYASGVTWQPNGAVAAFNYGNGVAHSQTQTTRGLPLVNRDAGVLQDSYAYDAAGNVTAITDQQEGVTTRSLGYDGLDRLTVANDPNVWGNASYAYDALDNLRTSVVGSRSTTHGYDASNRLSSLTVNGTATGYAYDARGNITGKGAQGYYFDLGNRLQLVNGKANYTYDGLGRRTSIAAADGSTRIQVYDMAGELLYGTRMLGGVTSTTRYINLGGKHIAEATNNVREYDHDDALGSPAARTNTAAGITSRTRYEAYGNAAAGTVPTGIGYTGHVNDADTGLVYMQQRYYDPVAGRFQSVDPVVTDAQTGDLFNRYVYAQSNPYRYTDPDGRCPSCLIGVLVEAAFEAYTGELNRSFSDAFEGKFGGLSVSVAKMGISAASGGVSTVLAEKGAAIAVKGAETATAVVGATTNLVALKGAEVVGVASAQAANGLASKVATNAVEGKSLSEGAGTAAAVGATVGTAGRYAGNMAAQALSGSVGATAGNAAKFGTQILTGGAKKETACSLKNGTTC